MSKTLLRIATEHRPADPLGPWGYRVASGAGVALGEGRGFKSESDARRDATARYPGMQLAATYLRRKEIGQTFGTKEAPFDTLAAEAHAYLNLGPMKRSQRMHELGHGIRALSINRGLDVLECRGERLEEIAAERARRSAKSAHTWRLSPTQRDPSRLAARDTAWLDRLQRSDWTARDAEV